MTDPNQPQDKRGAEIHLNAKKAQLVKMAELIVNDELSTFSQVNGYIWKEIESIDEELEG